MVVGARAAFEQQQQDQKQQQEEQQQQQEEEQEEGEGAQQAGSYFVARTAMLVEGSQTFVVRAPQGVYVCVRACA